MAATGAAVLLRNQAIEVDVRGTASGRICGSVADAAWTESLWPPDEFRIVLFSRLGISNGGLFWRSDCISDFEIKYSTGSPILHEAMRTYLLRDPIYIALEPLSVWRDNGAETLRSEMNRMRSWWHFLTVSRAMQIMRSRIYDELTNRGCLGILTSERLGSSPREREEGVLRSARSWPGRTALGLGRKCELRLKAYALKLLIMPPRGFTSVLARGP